MASQRGNELDFIKVTQADVLRWDREWAYYFKRFMNRQWFHNLAYADEHTRRFRQAVVGKNREAFFDYQAPLDRMELLVEANELLDRRVGEIGCGAGRLGRQLGHLAADYVGFDYSDMAVHIAKPLSPGNCDYVCIRDKEKITPYKGTRDIIVARHFFIHNNFENATWVLKLAKYLLKPGGTIVADFFVPADPSKGPGFHRQAKDALDPLSPSRVFLFSPGEIDELASLAGLRIAETTVKSWEGTGGPEGRRFVRLVS